MTSDTPATQPWPKVTRERVSEMADELSNYGLGLNERALSEMAYDIVRHLARLPSTTANGDAGAFAPASPEADTPRTA